MTPDTGPDQSDIVILVCGGREYGSFTRLSDAETLLDKPATQIFNVMSDFKRYCDGVGRKLIVVHGACKTGTDMIVDKWGEVNPTVVIRRHPADWPTYGRRAGPIRNREMHNTERPKIVIAFHGGRGTANMIGIAKGAGTNVIEIPRVES